MLLYGHISLNKLPEPSNRENEMKNAEIVEVVPGEIKSENSGLKNLTIYYKLIKNCNQTAMQSNNSSRIR